MLEIKYRDEDGEECVFLTPHKYLWDDPIMAAEEIAEEERNASGGDLYDTDCWPRTYEIEMNGKWVKVSVDMEYSPDFSASLVNSKD
jgi:hypothetical protein